MQHCMCIINFIVWRRQQFTDTALKCARPTQIHGKRKKNEWVQVARVAEKFQFHHLKFDRQSGWMNQQENIARCRRMEKTHTKLQWQQLQFTKLMWVFFGLQKVRRKTRTIFIANLYPVAGCRTDSFIDFIYLVTCNNNHGRYSYCCMRCIEVWKVANT